MKIIAEAGCNWSTIDEAKLFIDKSKELGLWATKFQIFDDKLIENHPDQQFLKSIMIDRNKAEQLLNYGKEIGQIVFFSVMYPDAVEWLEELNIPMYKIRFKDAKNIKIINKIEATKKPFFISMNYRNKPLSINGINLYCSPNYPSTPHQYSFFFNKKLYLENIGISSHCKGLKLLKKAIEYNVPYFEMHMMLNNINPLEKKWSISFNELKRFLINKEGKKRVCSKCYKEKELTEFYIGKDGIENRCKQCQNDNSNDWYSRNKINRFEYRNKKKEHYKQLNKEYSDKNKEKRNQQIQEWKNRQIIKAKGITSLSSLHRYIKRRKKEPETCEICNEKKKLDLASLTHIYTRNPEDYIYLCRSCHPIYDQCRRNKQLEEVLK